MTDKRTYQTARGPVTLSTNIDEELVKTLESKATEPPPEELLELLRKQRSNKNPA